MQVCSCKTVTACPVLRISSFSDKLRGCQSMYLVDKHRARGGAVVFADQRRALIVVWGPYMTQIEIFWAGGCQKAKKEFKSLKEDRGCLSDRLFR